MKTLLLFGLLLHGAPVQENQFEKVQLICSLQKAPDLCFLRPFKVSMYIDLKLKMIRVFPVPRVHTWRFVPKKYFNQEKELTQPIEQLPFIELRAFSESEDIQRLQSEATQAVEIKIADRLVYWLPEHYDEYNRLSNRYLVMLEDHGVLEFICPVDFKSFTQPGGDTTEKNQGEMVREIKYFIETIKLDPEKK